MLNLILLLIVSLTALAVGFARQEEQLVKVPLTSSVRLKGATYHPNSQGVEMPESHAKALGFGKDDYMGEEPEEEEDTGESESKGDSNEDDSSGESESEEPSDGKEGKEAEEESESKEEPEESEAEPIPDDTPLYDKLIKDERFATVPALLENQEQLTDVDGVADKTAANIVDHVTEAQKG